jgi:hypothetical protein
MWVNMLVPIGMKIIIEKNEMIKEKAAVSVVKQSIAFFHFIFVFKIEKFKAHRLMS